MEPKEKQMERLFADQASRVQMLNPLGDRYLKIQSLMCRLGALSERDFELAYRTLEGTLNATLSAQEEMASKEQKIQKNASLQKEVQALVAKKPLI
jgi:hypothetical protein